ncbi:MAG: NAD(P)H-binding protein [Anaerolineales bacterium]|nr:NAD(P)H-binding protein [Anaerolineales bacterium]
MILLTGGTGFIGRALARQLVESGQSVRILLRPSPRTPKLPIGVPVEVAVSSLTDVRGLRAALRGVDVLYHLAGGEAEGGRANLQAVDITGTRNLTEAARDAGVERIFYVSHLGADRGAAYPVLKAKGIAEDFVRKSGIPYTVMRGSMLFGVHDNFTTGIAKLLAAAPGFLPLPAGGDNLVQPLWLEDLVTCLVWALDDPSTSNHTFEIGGSEYLSVRQVFETIMEAIGKPRLLVKWPAPYMRILTVMMESLFPGYPASVFWLDYFATNRTCPVDTIPRVFGLMPARFASRLEHLRGVRWGWEYYKSLFVRRG